jgi:hypothetical protein
MEKRGKAASPALSRSVTGCPGDIYSPCFPVPGLLLGSWLLVGWALFSWDVHAQQGLLVGTT